MKNYSGSYSSITEFIDANKLEKQARNLFGENWEPDNDVRQVKMLCSNCNYVYVVSCDDDATVENYITVTRVIKDLDEDDINDMSVAIVGDLVLAGLVKDCTDTDDETEFEFQDSIRKTLAAKYNIEL